MQGISVGILRGLTLSLFLATGVLAQGKFESATGTGSAIETKDEGATLSTATTSFDFVGAGVTATAASGAITVTVPGGGAATFTVKDSTSTLSTVVTVLDFLKGFTIDESPSGEINVLQNHTEDPINLVTQVTGELPDANVADNITASSYLLLTAFIDSLSARVENGTLDSLYLDLGNFVYSPTDSSLLVDGEFRANGSIGQGVDGTGFGIRTSDVGLINNVDVGNGNVSLNGSGAFSVGDASDTQVNIVTDGGTVTVDGFIAGFDSLNGDGSNLVYSPTDTSLTLEGPINLSTNGTPDHLIVDENSTGRVTAIFRNNDALAAAEIAAINFEGLNDAAAAKTYGQLVAGINNPAAATSSGYWQMKNTAYLSLYPFGAAADAVQGIRFEELLANGTDYALLRGRDSFGAARTLYIPDSSGTIALLGNLHAAITLGGSYDYVTLSGQALTLGQVDLTTDVTGVLPDANVADDVTLTNITQILNRDHSSLGNLSTHTTTFIDSARAAQIADSLAGAAYSPTTGTFTGALVGNASTATALAANGANAASGNAILGVDASGAAEGAFDVWTEAENTSAAYLPAATFPDSLRENYRWRPGAASTAAGDSTLVIIAGVITKVDVATFPTGGGSSLVTQIDGFNASTATKLYDFVSGSFTISQATPDTFDIDLDTDLKTLAAPGNWRTFYSNGSAAVTPLAIGGSGTALISNGATSIPSWQAVALADSDYFKVTLDSMDNSTNKSTTNIVVLDSLQHDALTASRLLATDANKAMVNVLTEGNLESSITGTPNFIIAEEINTYAELNTIVADFTLTHNGLIDTYAELNTIVADVTLTHNGLIDTFAELDAIVADKALVNIPDIGKVWDNQALVTVAASDTLLIKDATDNTVQGILASDLIGAATPGGADTQVQYNNAGSLGGITGLTWDGTDLTIPSDVLLNMGTWSIEYDGAVDDQLIFLTAGTAASLTSDALAAIIVGGGVASGQEVFSVGKGTQASHTDLMHVTGNGQIYAAGGGDFGEANLQNVGIVSADAVYADASALTFGQGTETVAINSSDWDIDATGAITGVAFDANGTGNSLSNVDMAADITGITPVANGGSGRNTGTTAYSLIATGTTAAGVQQTLANGLTTQVLVGGGAAALPVWTAATGTGSPVRAASPTFTGTPVLPSAFTIAANSFTRSGAHNLTLTTSGATNVTLPTSGTLAALTSAMTGTYDGNNFAGGAIATGDILYGSGAGAISELAGVATGNALISGGVATAPSFGKIGLTTHVSGILPIANGGRNKATADTLLMHWGLVDSVYVEDLPGKKAPCNMTIVRVTGYTDANTSTYNIEIRANSTPNTAGTNVLTADQVADNNEQTTTTINTPSVTKGDYLVPSISATGDVEVLSINVEYIRR